MEATVIREQMAAITTAMLTVLVAGVTLMVTAAAGTRMVPEAGPMQTAPAVPGMRMVLRAGLTLMVLLVPVMQTATGLSLMQMEPLNLAQMLSQSEQGVLFN